jgi:starch phosphorylase
MLNHREENDGRRDVSQAIARMTERLPPALCPLARLAHNYVWSWLPHGEAVFRDIDPALWKRSGCNPRSLIEAASPRRFVELCDDPAYLERLRLLDARLTEELGRPPVDLGMAPERPVAYFCSEFGVHPSLPLYGGGLGVLAGDLLKAASDLAVPLVGVGLLYRQGYFHQRLDLGGWQHESWTTTHFEQTPAVLVTEPSGRPQVVEVEIRARRVRIQVWRVDIGRVPLYLLDTDREDNHPIDRWITARLYIGDRHTRLAQYAVLGIGGIRALAALGIEPSLVHLNEGHAGLGSLERLRCGIAAGSPSSDVLAEVRSGTIFTTHTPIAAGNEGYSLQEVEPVLGRFVDTIGIARESCFDLGRVKPGEESDSFGITPLALRTSRAANGVSRRHGEVARGMWQPLWPDRAVEDVPIGHVTNGVHTTTWMATAMQDLLDRHLPDWRRRISDAALWDAVRTIPDGEIWEVRRRLRRALVEYTREKSVFDRLSRGEAPGYVEAAATAFGDDALTIGFARRVATYKRLYLLTRNLDRGLRLLADRDRPIQVVIAGKAHPSDDEAKHSLRALLEARRAPHVGEHIAFLEDYDLRMAPLIVAGVDLWLNLPRPPLEASGTSGMKVLLNGGLNLSVLDGWWLEAYDGENGWAIASPEGDPATQDEADTTALFNLLENEIVPLFFEREPDGIPHRWIARAKASMGRLIPRFSAERMMRDYVAKLYTP